MAIPLIFKYRGAFNHANFLVIMRTSLKYPLIGEDSQEISLNM